MELFSEKVREVVDEKNFYLKNYFNAPTEAAEAVIDQFVQIKDKLIPFIADVASILAEGIEQDKTLLFEGAQGTHLDIEHGTYPFVTSSNVVAGNAANGSGVGPGNLDEIIGIVKAYTTRVGAGPFATELFDDIGDKIQQAGHEFGATTGRKRRCGWLDLVVLKNAARLNSLTGLAITKLDVLDNLDEIKICTAYEYNGETFKNFPAQIKVLSEAKPVYETMPGWKQDITKIRDYDQLPENAKKYLDRIQELSGVDIKIVSVGPEREATIIK